MKCSTTWTLIYQVPRNCYKEYQVPGIRKEKRQGMKEKLKKKKKNEKWNKNKHACAQGASRVRKRQGCCLLEIRWVLWCVQLMDGRERQKLPHEHNQDEGRDKAEKNKSRPHEVVGFHWTWICAGCFEVIWCVISQDTVYRDIVPYLYPEFLGLIWRYRIPSFYFSIPNTIFCQLSAPSLKHQESKRNGYLAIELQRSAICWKVYLIQNASIYLRVYG